MLGFGAVGQFAIGEIGTGTATGAEFIGPDKWMRALAEPVRSLPGLKAAAQQFISLNPQPFVSFSWFEPLAEPTRARPRSPATLYPSYFWQPAPSPFVATGWFEALSEPVRTKPGLKPSQQQFLSYQTDALTVTPFAWYANLSEPVRFKPGLPAALQRFFTTDTDVIPLTKLMEWFSAFSEPVRFKIGLGPWQQQFLASPTQLRPNPSVTGTISALETKDIFLGAGMSWERVAAGEIGVVDTSFPAAEIGVGSTGPVDATAAVISVKTSIRIE